MSGELTILALYGLVVVVIVLFHVVTAVMQVGLTMILNARDEMPELTGVAGRLERATQNAVVAMALFAPAILILAATGGLTASTLLAAKVFLIARIIHPVLYVMGIPLLRTLTWLAGFLATAWLYYLAI